MSELKPCPFCGCKKIRMHYSNNGAHSIYCNNCNVETCTSGGTDRCVTEWNTRAPQSEWISVDVELPRPREYREVFGIINGHNANGFGFVIECGAWVVDGAGHFDAKIEWHKAMTTPPKQ
jgi:Lar family restriction alleviation protein